ncbi:AsmA family protein [Candidatus Pelagibacter sp.]|nr:AsmA family protein [Candidatus Pelagibacter sp.]
MQKKITFIINFKKLLLTLNTRIKKLSFIKNFNKLILTLNTRIESFFNSIKILINTKKKTKIDLRNIDKKFLISIGSAVILVFSYFFIPAFYDKNLVKTKLTNQILEKYNLEVNFDGAISYRMFPTPHYFIKDTIIIYDEKNLAKIGIANIHISIENFLSFKSFKIKNLNFKKTEFDINSNNFGFFKEILNFNKSEYSINFTDSSLFFRDKYEDVIFLTKVDKLNFLYTDESDQQLNIKLKIFNNPFKADFINNIEKKKSFANIQSHKLRLNIKNNFDYSDANITGLLDFKVINKSKIIKYNLNKNSLNFNNDKNTFKGKFDFKPFYMSTDLKFHQIDIINLFKSSSIFLDLLNAEILNNQSLNAVVNIYSDKIKNVNYLSNIDLKTYFEEGNINIKNSTLSWKNSILINLEDVQLISENNSIILTGAMSFDFIDIDDFYRQYQVKKINRKKIKKIRLDFLLDINSKLIELENLKVDGFSNKAIDKFINNFNSKKQNIFNKIIFKNSIKEFFNNI